MLVKVKEATSYILHYLVTLADNGFNGRDVSLGRYLDGWAITQYTSNSSRCGNDIIDVEGITTSPTHDGEWAAAYVPEAGLNKAQWVYGKTRLEAAMRAFVIKHLGEEVEIQE